MKECSGKKVQKAKVAQNDPLDSPSQKNWPGGQQDQGHEVVLHVQEEVYWWTLTFRRSVAKYHGGSMRCPKFRNYDVSPGTKHKRGAKSRVKKLSVTRDQSSIFFLEVYPIPFLGLDLIDPRSSCFILFWLASFHYALRMHMRASRSSAAASAGSILKQESLL